MGRHIVSENKIAIEILIVVGILVYFNTLFDTHEFNEMQRRPICELKLAFNNPNVQGPLILQESRLDDMDAIGDMRFNLLKIVSYEHSSIPFRSP